MLLLINKMYPPEIGGVEVITQQLAEICKDINENPTILTFNNNRESLIEDKNGISIHRLGTFLRHRSIRFSFRYKKYYKNLSEQSKITIFNYPSFQPELYCPNKNNINIVCYHADNTKFGIIGKLYQRIIARRFLKNADYIITSSPNIIESSYVLRKNKEKCYTIPFGIDIEHFSYKESNKREEIISEFKERKSLNIDRIIILFVGRMSRYKGFQYLLKSLALLPKEYCLLLVSSDKMDKKYKKIIFDKNLQNRIIHFNDVSYQELPEYYSVADVFVLPSTDRAEAFGLVAIEAMACGIPVITTELGTGTSFHNIHNETGLIIPPKDEDKLAEAIKYISENKKQFSPDIIRKRAEDFGEKRFKEEWKEFITSKIKAMKIKL